MKTGTVLSDRGQITLPKRVRDHLGLKPGMELDVREVRGGALVTKRVRESPWRAAVGLFGRGRNVDKLIEEMRGKPDAID